MVDRYTYLTYWKLENNNYYYFIIFQEEAHSEIRDFQDRSLDDITIEEGYVVTQFYKKNHLYIPV